MRSQVSSAGGTGGSNKSGANKDVCWMPVIWELITPTYLQFPTVWHQAKPRTWASLCSKVSDDSLRFAGMDVGAKADG